MIHKIGSYTVPVPEGISLPLVMRSPLFDNSDGKTPGSFIFNTRQPASPELRAAFEQGHRATRNGRATSELPYVFELGSLRFSGKCTLQEADDQYYEIKYNIRNGDFAAEAATKTLKDLDLGGERVITSTYTFAYHNENVISSHAESLLFILFFTTKYVDFGNNFDLTNTVFTSDSETNLKIYLRFSLSNTDIENYQVRLYKNSAIEQTFSLLYDLNEINTDLNVSPGDTLYWAIYAEKKEGLLRYTMTDIFIEYHDTNIFNEVVELDQDSSDFVAFPIENPNFFDNFPKDEFQIDNVNIGKVYSENFFVQNYWKNNNFPFMLSGEINGEYIFANNLFTPFVYIKYLIEKVAELLNYELIDSPFVSESPYFNAVLYNAFGENTYEIDDASMINVKPTFNLTDHVPDVAISTFMNAIGKITGRRIDIDTEFRTITFVRLRTVIEATASVPFPGIITEAPVVTVAPEYKGFKLELKASADKYISERVKEVNPKHVYKGSVTHLNELPETNNKVNDMYLVTALNELYVWKYSTEVYHLAWGFHSKNFYLTRQYGAEPFYQVSADIAPVLDQRVLDETVGAPSNRFWIVPVTWQPGNFEGYPDMSAEYGLQILFYKGFNTDSNDETYPMAISSNTNYAGETFTNPNICIDGLTPNLYTDELQVWLQWLVYNTKPVKFKAVLTPGQLRQLKYSTKYRILGNNYLIKEIRGNILIDRLSEVEIEAYSC